MTFIPWPRWFRACRIALTCKPRPQTVVTRRGRVFRLDVLEDRTLPSTFTVMNLNDGGPGSLRAGIASGDNIIVFANELHGTITLTSGELLISNSVTITGPGANKLAVSGNNASEVFNISGASASMSGLTITQGSAS